MRIFIPGIGGWGTVATNFWLNFVFGIYFHSWANLLISIICLFILLPFRSFMILKDYDHNPFTWNGKSGSASNEYMKETNVIPLIIDDNVRREIELLKERANNNIIEMHNLKISGELKEGDPNPIGDNGDHVIQIPAGFTVVYSIENQGEGTTENGGKLLGKCRHLSVSVHLEGRVPAIEAMEMIAKEFGFSPLYECAIWPEDPGGGKVAINVLEPLDGFPKILINDVRNAFIEIVDGIREKGYGEYIISTIDTMRDIH